MLNDNEEFLQLKEEFDEWREKKHRAINEIEFQREVLVMCDIRLARLKEKAQEIKTEK